MKGKRRAIRVEDRQKRRCESKRINIAEKKRIAEEKRVMKVEEAVLVIEENKTHNEKMFAKQRLNTRIRKQRFISALKKSVGVASAAQEKSQVSRATYEKWMRECPWFQDRVAEMADWALDFVETSLFKQIKDGVPGSTIFYLKTKGKKRGYVERTEVVSTITNKFEGMTDEDLITLLEKQEQAQLNERKTIRIESNNDR